MNKEFTRSITIRATPDHFHFLLLEGPGLPVYRVSVLFNGPFEPPVIFNMCKDQYSEDYSIVREIPPRPTPALFSIKQDVISMEIRKANGYIEPEKEKNKLMGLFQGLSVTTIAIFFMFFCGSLYLVLFWSTFDINVSNLFNLTDIPKNFVMPLVWANAVFLVFTIINLLDANHEKERVPENQQENQVPKSRWKNPDFYLKLAMILLPTFFLVLLLKFKMNPAFWKLSAVSIGLVYSFKLQRSVFLRKLIPYYFLRTYIAQFTCVLPLISLATGKSDSLNIYNNTNSKFVRFHKELTNQKQTDTSRLKFIGFVGDKIATSTIDNKSVYFIDQKAYNVVEIIEGSDTDRKGN